MARDEVGHHVLLEAVFRGEALEALDERVVDLAARLAHHREHRVAHVLGRQTQLAAHVVLQQLHQELVARVGHGVVEADSAAHELQQLHQELVARVGHGVVEADSAAHEDLLHARDLPQVAQQLGVGILICVHVAADVRPQAAAVLAHAVGELLFARRLEEVRRGAAHIVDITLELGVVCEDLGFAHDARAAAHLHHAALVEGERAEGALAKAPAVAGDGEADLVEGRDASGRIVVGVPVARVGQLGHFVHLALGEGRRGWVLYHVDAVGIGLYQSSARDGVHVLLLDVEGARVSEAVALELVPGGEQFVVEDVVQRPRAARAVDRAVHEGDLVHGQSAVERVRNLDDRVLAHAVEQDVGAGVEQDGALELVLPVVVVREAAQARLDAADDDGLVLEGAADEVAVDRDGAVGTCARASAGGVGVLARPCRRAGCRRRNRAGRSA